MDLNELFFIGLEAFFAGICWTFGGMLAEAVADKLFPPDDDDDQQPPVQQVEPPQRKGKRKPRHVFTALPLLAIVAACSPACRHHPDRSVSEPGVPVPDYATRIDCRLPVADCGRWSPKNVQKALDMWLIAYGDVFGYMPAIPRLIVVEDAWDLGSAGPDVPSTTGKTSGVDSIRIAGRYFYGLHHVISLPSSAFSHELMHVALWNALGDPDPNHAVPPGPWSRYHDEFLRAFDADLILTFGVE